MRDIVIIQRITGHYRNSFFKELNEILNKDNISLTVLYGQPEKNESEIGIVDFKNAIKIRNKYFRIRNKYLVFQCVFRKLRKNDLIIIQQGRKIISNYLLLWYLVCGL